MALDPDEQRMLNKTLMVREQIVDQLFQNGRIPGDKEDREFLVKAMDGMDRTILGKARLKLDETANKNQAAMQDMVANVMLRISTNPAVPGTTPRIDTTIARDNPVEGETDIGVETGSYEEFMNRMG